MIIPLIQDKREDIIRSIATLNIVHQCKKINLANTYPINPEQAERWLKGTTKRNFKTFYLCQHIMTVLIHLANNPKVKYSVDYGGVLKEDKLVETIGPQLRFINKSETLSLRDLNREMSQRIFDDTRLNDLINRELFEIWVRDTSV